MLEVEEGRKKKPFTSCQWGAVDELPAEEQQAGGGWEGQAAECLPNEMPSSFEVWQRCQTRCLEPWKGQEALLPHLVLPFFSKAVDQKKILGFPLSTTKSYSLKQWRINPTYVFVKMDYGHVFLPHVHCCTTSPDANKNCHLEGTEGDLAQPVTYGRNSLITSSVAYLPKTIAVSFRNHQCST